MIPKLIHTPQHRKSSPTQLLAQRKYSMTPFNITSLARDHLNIHSSITVKHQQGTSIGRFIPEMNSFKEKLQKKDSLETGLTSEFLSSYIVQSLESTDSFEFGPTNQASKRTDLIKLQRNAERQFLVGDSSDSESIKTQWVRQKYSQDREKFEPTLFDQIPTPNSILMTDCGLPDSVVEKYMSERKKRGNGQAISFRQGWINSLNCLYYCVGKHLYFIEPNSLLSHSHQHVVTLPDILNNLVETEVPAKTLSSNWSGKIVIMSHPWYLDFYSLIPSYSRNPHIQLSSLNVRLEVHHPNLEYFAVTNLSPKSSNESPSLSIHYQDREGSIYSAKVSFEITAKSTATKTIRLSQNERIKITEVSERPSKQSLSLITKIKQGLDGDWVKQFGKSLWIQVVKKSRESGLIRVQNSNYLSETRLVETQYDYCSGVAFFLYQQTQTDRLMKQWIKAINFQTKSLKTIKVPTDILDSKRTLGLPQQLLSAEKPGLISNMKISVNRMIYAKGKLYLILSTGHLMSLNFNKTLKFEIVEVINPSVSHAPSDQCYVASNSTHDNFFSGLIIEKESNLSDYCLTWDRKHYLGRIARKKTSENYLYQQSSKPELVHATDQGYSFLRLIRYEDWLYSILNSSCVSEDIQSQNLTSHLIRPQINEKQDRDIEDQAFLQLYLSLLKIICSVDQSYYQMDITSSNQSLLVQEISFEDIPNKVIKLAQKLIKAMVNRQTKYLPSNADECSQESKFRTIDITFFKAKAQKNQQIEKVPPRDSEEAEKQQQSKQPKHKAKQQSGVEGNVFIDMVYPKLPHPDTIGTFRSSLSRSIQQNSKSIISSGKGYTTNNKKKMAQLRSEFVRDRQIFFYAVVQTVKCLLSNYWSETDVYSVPYETVIEKIILLEKCMAECLEDPKTRRLFQDEQKAEQNQYICSAWEEEEKHQKEAHAIKSPGSTKVTRSKNQHDFPAKTSNLGKNKLMDSHRNYKPIISIAFIDRIRQLLFCLHLCTHASHTAIQSLTLKEAFAQSTSFFYQYLFDYYTTEYHPDLLGMMSSVLPLYVDEPLIKCMNIHSAVCPISAKNRGTILQIVCKSFKCKQEIPDYLQKYLSSSKGVVIQDYTFYYPTGEPTEDATHDI